MALSKRLRYEVLRRDNYACRYCGRSAPGVELAVDHVTPVSLGGTDDPGNLVTACTECNSGKSSSSPDQPLVEDVSADALRWGRAIQAAAEVLLADHDARAERHSQFLASWNDWTYGSPDSRQRFPLPGGWEQSVDAIDAAGLPAEILSECVDIAMRASHVEVDQTFRYMCGVAWNKVGLLREIASQVLGASDDDEPAPEFEDSSGSTGEIAAARRRARAEGAGPPPAGLLDKYRVKPGQENG